MGPRGLSRGRCCAMDLFVTDPQGRTVSRIRSFELDMAFGADENDFELSAPKASGIEPGSHIFVPGTEYGGVVSVLCPVRTRYGDAISYKGRTWHGILEDHVICPLSGKAYLTVSGDANAVLCQLIQAMGLGDIFSAGSYAGINVAGSFRYRSGYTGIVEMLAASGARLKAAWDTATMKCVLSAVPVRDWGDMPGVSGSTMYSAELDYRKYNHLIALGKGEGTSRTVYHLYSDAAGNISEHQTMRGLDERTYIYDYSNAELKDLKVKAREKLAKLRQTDTIDVDLDSGTGVAVGDTVTAYSPAVGVSTRGTITKLTVKVANGYTTVTPDFTAWKDEQDYE
nr:MAG TPA: Protein gp18.1, prophage tail protein gp18.7A [Caudoviricetes sp.]